MNPLTLLHVHRGAYGGTTRRRVTKVPRMATQPIFRTGTPNRYVVEVVDSRWRGGHEGMKDPNEGHPFGPRLVCAGASRAHDSGELVANYGAANSFQAVGH